MGETEPQVVIPVVRVPVVAVGNSAVLCVVVPAAAAVHAVRALDDYPFPGKPDKVNFKWNETTSRVLIFGTHI